jgi:hypothetical protein
MVLNELTIGDLKDYKPVKIHASGAAEGLLLESHQPTMAAT